MSGAGRGGGGPRRRAGSGAKHYGEDLAYIHDVGFGSFAREAAPGLLSILRKAGIRSGRVIDLGCGSGIWAAALCGAGYDVVGVDISADMLGRASGFPRGATGRFCCTPLRIMRGGGWFAGS
jgi:SAM-dependent methyltransferase